jgi:hypothetical protein
VAIGLRPELLEAAARRKGIERISVALQANFAMKITRYFGFVVMFVVALAACPALAQEPEPPAVDAAAPTDTPKSPPNELTRGDKALIDDKAATDPAETARAKATFVDKFNKYKDALREIEKLNVEFQKADEATRKKLNEQLTGEVAHAQSLVNEMVDAAMAAYRGSPNTDPQITDLLVAVARYYTIGRQTGPGIAMPGNAEDVFYPIDGGDQYERALPIIKLLIEGGNDTKQLYAWDFWQRPTRANTNSRTST